ncbi:MAG TPA: zonular occludens toxin domain-containing protein [Oligella sp.]|nr:zonular occludens toxin domain-containing protein [Oligella sp.]
MIKLITAVPGSGKTLSAIGLIQEALKEGRPVFTNINGLINDKFENGHLIQPAPDDWRDTPEGSLVIYDEAQQAHLYPSNAQRGKVEDERLTAMETHRHTGHDLVFITQAPTFVHHHIRKLVGEHVHLYRGRGLKGAMRYEWSHTCDSPNDRREQERATSAFWSFPKADFEKYTSAVVHTHKFKMPWKIAAAILVALLALGYSAFNLMSNDGLAIMNESRLLPSTAANVQPPAGTRADTSISNLYDWSSVEEVVPIGGCMANHDDSRCQCYSTNGTTLNIPHAQCLSILTSPLPRTIKINQSKQG